MTNDLGAAVDVAELASRLRIALMRSVRRLRRETGDDHSVSAISALSSLRKKGSLTVGELADAEGVSRPSMTVLVGAMQEQGLVTREADPRDARLVRVSLAPAGLEALNVSRARRNAYLTAWLSGLGEKDRSVLDRAAAILQGLTEL